MVNPISKLTREYQTFGFRFLAEGIQAEFRKKGSVTVPTKRFGSITFRRSEDDLAILRAVLEYGEYDTARIPHAEDRLRRAYQEMLDAGKTPVIVDAGANIGAATIWFAAHYPRATVVAIEPEPGNVEILRKNIGHFKNVIVLDGAIGANGGYVTINSRTASVAGRTERADDGIKIYTVQDAVDAVPNGALFIAKIDIEGFEKDLFSTNIDWIDQASAVMLEPHDWMLPGEKSSHSFQKALGDKGFDIFVQGENLFYVRP